MQLVIRLLSHSRLIVLMLLRDGLMGVFFFFSVKNGAFCLEFEIFYLSLYCTS